MKSYKHIHKAMFYVDHTVGFCRAFQFYKVFLIRVTGHNIIHGTADKKNIWLLNYELLFCLCEILYSLTSCGLLFQMKYSMQ